MNLSFISAWATWSHDTTLRMLEPFVGTGIGELVFLTLFASTLFSICAGYAMFGGLLERKMIARVHSRRGPMYTGPGGILQTAADAIKFIKKEIIVPQGADAFLYKAAPLLLALPPFLAFAFLPLGSFVLLRADYGIIAVFALLSLSPIAVLAGSWASNSKYSSLGGLRAAGMTIAYETLLALCVASVILTTHTMSIIGVVQYQAAHGVWLAAVQPLAFILFAVAVLASVERNPFDLTEAESELVSGWRTEYGGVYFSLTLLGEYIKLLGSIILMTCLFLGGWNGPLGDVGFILKVLVLTLLMFYIRATAMRVRMDQLIRGIWTKLIPAALLNIIVTLIVLGAIGGGGAQ